MTSDIVIFPKFITIKDINHSKKYASRIGPFGVEFAKDDLDEYCYFEVIEQINGTNKIKLKLDNGNIVHLFKSNDDNKKYLTKNTVFKNLGNTIPMTTRIDVNNYIHSSKDYDLYKDNDIFEFIKLENDGSNIFAIKSVNNNNFVSVWDTKFPYDDEVKHMLKPDKKSIDKYCKFKIEEPYIKKEIINIKYYLDKANTKESTPEIAAKKYAENYNHDKDLVITLGYSYKKSETGTWNNSAGVELTSEITFSAGIPFIVSNELKLGLTASYTREWGSSKTTEKEINGNLQVSIPPRRKGNVTISVSKAIIDVPFKYTTRTKYLNGHIETKEDIDGIYNNLESYNINADTSELKDLNK